MDMLPNKLVRRFSSFCVWVLPIHVATQFSSTSPVFDAVVVQPPQPQPLPYLNLHLPPASSLRPPLFATDVTSVTTTIPNRHHLRNLHLQPPPSNCGHHCLRKTTPSWPHLVLLCSTPTSRSDLLLFCFPILEVLCTFSWLLMTF